MGTLRGLGAGHAACAGCPAPTVVQAAIYAAREALGCEPIVTFATGCMEVVSSLYPHNAWRIPFLHSGFANSAAAASGLEVAIRVRRRWRVATPIGGMGTQYHLRRVRDISVAHGAHLVVIVRTAAVRA